MGEAYRDRLCSSCAGGDLLERARQRAAEAKAAAIARDQQLVDERRAR